MKNYSLLALLAAVPALAWVPPAAAQTGAKSGSGIEEIVITAQRRTETVQKSSLSIQVLSSEELTRAGVTEPKDLQRLVPGMQVGTAVGGAFVFIRGVGDATASQTANPGVSFNLNGVNLGRPDSNALQFYDLERIEVLKGPQGTLYGRNAVGGAVNLLARKPDFSGFSGYASFEAGNYELKHGAGAINLPVSDKLALRGAFDIVDRDGYLTNGANDDKHEAGRLSSLWRPTDAFTMYTVIDYAHQHGVGSGSVLYPRPPGAPAFLGTTDPQAINYIGAQGPVGSTQAFGATFPPGPPAFVPFHSEGLSAANLGSPPFIDLDAWGISNEFNYDMGWATLTVLPAYRETHIKDRAFLAWQDFHIYRTRQFSTEARLSKNTETLKWVAGLYYFYEDVKGSSYIDRGNQLTTATFPTNATRSYAGFAQATYSIIPDLRVIAGVRYTLDYRRLAGEQNSLVVVQLAPPPTPPSVFPVGAAFDGTRRFYALTWKGGLEYDITPNNMLYFTASTGFKSGGINAELPPNGYSPEKLTAFQLGSRNRFLNDKLQVNLELFKWDYRDHQEGGVAYDNSVPPSPSFLVSNAGAATVEGFNVDIEAKVTPHDTVRGIVEYNHSRYDSFVLTQPFFTVTPGVTTGCGVSPPNFITGTVTLDCAGFQLARAPMWTASASWEHVFPLANGAQLIALASAQYASSRWGSIDFIPITRFPGYITGDFDLTYTPESGRWSLTGFIRNISDEIVPTSTYLGNLPTAASQSVLPPRTYGGRLTVNF